MFAFLFYLYHPTSQWGFCQVWRHTTKTEGCHHHHLSCAKKSHENGQFDPNKIVTTSILSFKKRLRTPKSSELRYTLSVSTPSSPCWQHVLLCPVITSKHIDIDTGLYSLLFCCCIACLLVCLIVFPVPPWATNNVSSFHNVVISHTYRWRLGFSSHYKGWTKRFGQLLQQFTFFIPCDPVMKRYRPSLI